MSRPHSNHTKKVFHMMMPSCSGGGGGRESEGSQQVLTVSERCCSTVESCPLNWSIRSSLALRPDSTPCHTPSMSTRTRPCTTCSVLKAIIIHVHVHVVYTVQSFFKLFYSYLVLFFSMWSYTHMYMYNVCKVHLLYSEYIHVHVHVC